MVTSLWSQVSGPGVATFADDTNPTSSVSFDVAGSYVLELTGDDGLLQTSDQVTVTVDPPANTAPVVDAGVDQSITLGDGAVLDGSVSDDGLPDPPGVVTSLWSQVSGPGVATFADDTNPTSSVSFDVAGSYVLELTGDDGLLQTSDQVTVTVDPANTAPVVDAGVDQSITFGGWGGFGWVGVR